MYCSSSCRNPLSKPAYSAEFEPGRSHSGTPKLDMSMPYLKLDDMRMYSKGPGVKDNESSGGIYKGVRDPLELGYSPGTSSSGTPSLSDDYISQIAQSRITNGWKEPCPH